MATIEVSRLGETTFEVRVQAARPTVHVVTVDAAYAQRLTRGRVPVEQLVRRSFDFLLAREPSTSILGRFDLPVIGRYFPEYERTIVGMLD